MQNPLLKQTVVADFFGHGYRVSGALNVTKRSLADTIFDSTTDYLELSDAYLSPVTDPASIAGYYRTTLYNKSHIDFVLTAEQKDGLRRDQVYILSQRKFEVSLTVPFFEIRGDLYSIMTLFQPRSYLSGEAGPFITLLNPVARCTFNPDVAYKGAVALVNRVEISFFGERSS
jgi:hypothetical protein